VVVLPKTRGVLFPENVIVGRMTVPWWLLNAEFSETPRAYAFLLTCAAAVASDVKLEWNSPKFWIAPYPRGVETGFLIKGLASGDMQML
jgi:hypothetical protein